VQTTAAGNLRAKYVIHAVGPFYNERYADKACAQLRQVHQLALEAAVHRDCRSIAFPAISTGAYRFPIADAAMIAIDIAGDFLNRQRGLELVRFVLYKQSQFDVFQTALDAWRDEHIPATGDAGRTKN
jgi:O-acetyl-ADP-ribose deacetylase (regulator of RNase III)